MKIYYIKNVSYVRVVPVSTSHIVISVN